MDLQKNEKLYYVDLDGNYGNAHGMLIIREQDLGYRGKERFSEALDKGENLMTWAIKALTGVRKSSLEVRGSGVVITPALSKQMDEQFGGLI